MNKKFLHIRGAREKNLQEIEVKIPKDKLVVITGVSGSGKTSLAFSTIYKEGKRRYVESLSSYARQFLGNSDKPDVDQIDGLSPAIAIDQKTVGHNPRSIVGTITEIYDYLRVLYARAGTSYCINGHGKIETMTIKQMMVQLQKILIPGTEITIYSPTFQEKKGTFKQHFTKLKKDGFYEVLVDDQVYTLDEPIVLDKNHKHTIAIMIDRIYYQVDQATQTRIYSSLETAVKYSEGLALITYLDQTKKQQKAWFSELFNCQVCNFGLKELEPRLFSFNTVSGACYECKGIGKVLGLDFPKLVPNPELTINQGGIAYYASLIATNHRDWLSFQAMCKKFDISLNQPVKNLTDAQWSLILNGTKTKVAYTFVSKEGKNRWKFNHPFTGLETMIKKRFLQTKDRSIHHIMAKKFLAYHVCRSCHGDRLNPEALSVKISDLNIAEFTKLTINKALLFVKKLSFSAQTQEIIRLVLAEIINRLTFLNRLGLGYLSLNRHAQTLSGGEAQRIRLATQIGSKLTGILYVLDEPSIGLHQYDNHKLIKILKSMRDLGNSVLVVEHDEEMIRNADWIVDIGLLGGIYGGKLIHSGSISELLNHPTSITAKFLNDQELIPIPKKRRTKATKTLKFTGVAANNLQNLTFKLPLNKLVLLTGISGSGKSTLMNDIIYRGVKRKIDPLFREQPGKFTDVEGTKHVDRLILISQEPIGKTPRSNPATYTSVFDEIRSLFAATFLAKKRGYKSGRFSFNLPDGRCQSCNGHGLIFHAMLFLPDVFVKCEECQGTRYNPETLQVTFNGKNIAQVLDMEIDAARKFFINQPKILQKLEILIEVGLGYLKLGQPSTQLSGGEAQRIKLATYLQKKPTGKTIYLLDEPTTGLHRYDVKKLLKLLNRLVDSGETVLLIEHNLDMIKSADHIIDLGPKGGEYGGKIIAEGTPEQVAKIKASYTGKYLAPLLKKT